MILVTDGNDACHKTGDTPVVGQTTTTSGETGKLAHGGTRHSSLCRDSCRSEEICGGKETAISCRIDTYFNFPPRDVHHDNDNIQIVAASNVRGPS